MERDRFVHFTSPSSVGSNHADSFSAHNLRLCSDCGGARIKTIKTMEENGHMKGVSVRCPTCKGIGYVS